VFDWPWHSGLTSDPAKLQLGFDLDYGTTKAAADLWRKKVIVHNWPRKPWIPAQGARHSPARSRSPWSRGSRSPTLRGVLVWVERNFWDAKEDAERYHREQYPKINEMLSHLLDTASVIRTFDVHTSTTHRVVAGRAA